MTIAGENFTERAGLRLQYNNNSTCKMDMIMEILDRALTPSKIVYIDKNV